MYLFESRNQEKWHKKTEWTFDGHMSVSFRVFLTSVSPPTSSQPSSPAWCSGTFLMDAGVNPFMASSKSACVRIISGWGLSADCSGLLSNKQNESRHSVTMVKLTYQELIFTKSGIWVYTHCFEWTQNPYCYEDDGTLITKNYGCMV